MGDILYAVYMIIGIIIGAIISIYMITTIWNICNPKERICLAFLAGFTFIGLMYVWPVSIIMFLIMLFKKHLKNKK